MANQSKDNWAAIARRAWAEDRAYRQKRISRSDLVKAFGISVAQASADLIRLKRDFGCLWYDRKLKIYQWRSGAKPKLKPPFPIAAFVREGVKP